MENSAKALLMAGGVLITMLIVVLLFYFKGRITEFYDEQKQIDDIANVAEFNKQFTNYERQKVYGYEIISLSNMVEDYNTRHSGAEGAQNDEKYTPISLTVSFVGSGDKVQKQMWYNNDGGVHLFNDGQTYIQSDTNNTIATIIDRATNIENKYDAQIASKLAKSIKTLIVDEEEDSYEIENMMRTQNIDKQSAISALKQRTVNDFKVMTNDEKTYEQIEQLLLNGYNGISIKTYYEYIQFKRAVFKCTGIGYDNEIGGSGRVTSLSFSFVRVE